MRQVLCNFDKENKLGLRRIKLLLMGWKENFDFCIIVYNCGASASL
jgi:hypothetical protein